MSSKAPTNDEETLKRVEEARTKFEQNYAEFRRKKVKEIPCFRSTFLTSIPSGLVIGALTYLVTSRARLAANLAFGSFTLVTAGYFTNCRMEFNKQVQQNKELGDLMNMIIKYKGTELEEQFQKKYSEKLLEMDSKSKFV